VQTNSDGIATVWTPGFVLRTHLDSVRALAFTANHPALLSASDDGTVKLWNLRKLTRDRCVSVPAGRWF
jgi:WD40 repeat protein